MKDLRDLLKRLDDVLEHVDPADMGVILRYFAARRAIMRALEQRPGVRDIAAMWAGIGKDWN